MNIERELRRELRRGRRRIVLQVLGVCLFSVGLMCLPNAFSVNPYRDTSAFNNLVDIHGFVGLALVFMCLGGVVFALSYLFPDGP
jgi:hypothetical protein